MAHFSTKPSPAREEKTRKKHLSDLKNSTTNDNNSNRYQSRTSIRIRPRSPWMTSPLSLCFRLFLFFQAILSHTTTPRERQCVLPFTSPRQRNREKRCEGVLHHGPIALFPFSPPHPAPPFFPSLFFFKSMGNQTNNVYSKKSKKVAREKTTGPQSTF